MRYLFLIVLTVLLGVNTSGQEGMVRIITQPEWPPGKYVPVRIEVKNTGMDGFARLYQDLPQGFDIRKGNTAGADFYLENNQVNFVWVSIPETDIITVSYLAKADESLTGSFRMAARIDYIINGDERRTEETEPVLILLDRNADVEEVLSISGSGPEEPFVNQSVKHDTITVKDHVAEVEFRVQVAISSEHLSKEELENRINCKLRYRIKILRTGNMFKYQSGVFNKYDEASVYLNELKECGVNDAFIVAFRGEEQIPVELARTLSE